jgi:hypothetical protein
MAARLDRIRMAVVPDEYGDASWLEQEGMGFEDRLEAYRRGEFGLVGIQAVATIEIPAGDYVIVQTVSSPGMWGVESDSGDDYFTELYEQEKETLYEMLRELNVSGVEV